MTEELTKEVAKNTTNIALLTQAMGTTNKTIKELCVTIEKNTEQNGKSFKGIDEALRGSKDNPGLFVRMDRQEQFTKRIKAILGTIITAIVGIITALFVWILGLFESKG